MNEEALKDAYNQFANTGYDGDQNEFYTLLSENSEAFADSYGLFKGSGYDGSEDDYKTLLGLKKKTIQLSQAYYPRRVQRILHYSRSFLSLHWKKLLRIV